MIEQGVMAAKAILMGMLMSNGPVDNFTVEETYCMAGMKTQQYMMKLVCDTIMQNGGNT